ncbi:MAG: sensor histidine kinase, partial [Deltaproteobacteria bacterium]
AASLERAVRLADRVRGGDRDGALDGLDSSLDTAILCCQRLQGIARNMTACARPTRDDRTLIAVTSVVDEAIALVEPGLPPGTHVSRDYDPGLPPIRANPGQLVQVFVNLLMNAGHAVAGIDGDRRIEVEASMGDDWVCVDVRDNGPGIPQELRDRLFEPFFTTKPDGTGTGLGLAVSLDIAHAHGGHIAVGGEVGRGATFSVVLPLRLHDEPGDGVR